MDKVAERETERNEPRRGRGGEGDVANGNIAMPNRNEKKRCFDRDGCVTAEKRGGAWRKKERERERERGSVGIWQLVRYVGAKQPTKPTGKSL